MRVIKDKDGGIVRRVLLLDDGGEPVVPVVRYLGHLIDAGYSPHTACAYGYDLRYLFEFLGAEGVSWQAFGPSTALIFLGHLRRRPTRRPAQRLGLAVATGEGWRTSRWEARPSPRRRRGAGRIATIGWLCSTVHVIPRHVLCNTVPPVGGRRTRGSGRGDGGEQLRPLGELPVRQVVVEHALPGRLPKATRLGGIGQQPGQRRREGIVVLGLDQHAVLAVGDLVEDAADAAGDHRPRLPHRLGHGQAEALHQALLGDDAGVLLDRVHDGRILVRVVHRH